MIKLKKPPKVKFFVGMISKDEDIMKEALSILKEKAGDVEFESPLFPFEHTDYYEKEMGKNLKRKFYSFKPLREPDEIVDFKIFAIEVEKKFLDNEKRKVNIDPGYVELSKVVLSSTKNYSHRIYLGKGIYAEVTLFFAKGEFMDFPYTYPDYRTKEYKEFFKIVREALKRGL
ncbi:MAG: DUF4416 family protein [Candidatus Hydrothermales bacterium]